MPHAILSPTTTGELSAAGRRRLLARRGEPLLLAAWKRTLMVHFEVPVEALQRDVPYELDLWEGRAFVSLVAFTMLGMHPRRGGPLGALLFRPIATHHFFNVRTYVRHDQETGIHFLAEWLSNRLAASLGPVTFGLPYHYGRIHYQHPLPAGDLRGRVEDATTGAALVYQGRAGEPTPFAPCESGSLDEWLMERYTAFNSAGHRQRFFRVWHPPWPQRPVEVQMLDDSLLRDNWPWFAEAEMVGANYSPGFDEVWMGKPHRI